MSHGLVLASGYTAPGPIEFFFPDFTGKHWNEHGYDSLLTKSSVLLVVGALVAGWFLYSSSKRRSIVPGRFQFAGEQGYSFIRNGVAQDIIGKGYAKFVPLLVSLFFFLLINNLFGIVPFLSFAPFSRASFAYGLTAMVWVLYNGIGIKDKGFFGYLKHTTVPSGVPWPLLFLLVPLEFMSNILVRPLTLSLRLFANMFAGHLLVVLFSTGGAWLLLDATGSVVLKPAGVLAYLMGVGICFLELIVATLQAYVFTLLTATYIGGALAHEH